MFLFVINYCVLVVCLIVSRDNIMGYNIEIVCLQAYVSWKHEDDKVIACERAGLLFVFNFHPSKSFTDYRVGVEKPGEYRIVFDSDEGRFGGFDRVDKKVTHLTFPEGHAGRQNSLLVRLTQTRTIGSHSHRNYLLRDSNEYGCMI